MRLRLIDKYCEDTHDSAIELVLDGAQCHEHYHIQHYQTPFNPGFRETLTWYFNEYPKHPAQENEGTPAQDRGVVEKLITFGQYLGDQLIGEDDQLYKLIHKIETEGYANLEVCIESSRCEFFDDLWETAILPGSAYVLSSASKNFQRRVTAHQPAEDPAELHFDLKVAPPQLDIIPDQLTDEAQKTHATSIANDNCPLKILHIVFHSTDNQRVDNYSDSCAYNTSVELLDTEAAIEYEIFVLERWSDLNQRLETGGFHIVHLDCPVLVEQEVYYFGRKTESADTKITFLQLVNLLLAHKIPLLCAAISNTSTHSAQYLLAQLAKSAHQAGLGNVIGLGERVEPWLSQQCFSIFYRYLTKGLSLGQTVVETRKALQSVLETSALVSNALPFQYWSLLVHYGKQELVFFACPQVITPLEESQAFAHSQRKLLGFKADRLSAPLASIADGYLLALVSHWQQSRYALSISGHQGTGKTHLLHQFCQYLAQRQTIDYAFYFDFADDVYSPDNMLTMIAPVLGLEMGQADATLAKMQSLKCCIVLDGVHPDMAGLEELDHFLNARLADGHSLLVAGKDLDRCFTVNFAHTQLGSMSPAAQTMLAAKCLQQNNLSGVDGHKQWPALLQSLAGNPFLIQKIIPLLSHSSPDKLLPQINEHLLQKTQGLQSDGLVTAFYEWQWSILPGAWQQMLLLCTEVENLVLEVLMIASDQKESFEPATHLFTALGIEPQTSTTSKSTTQASTIPAATTIAFSKGIDLWEKAGFLIKMPHGRKVDRRALAFLITKQKALTKQKESAKPHNENQTAILLGFSQVLCEGIRITATHLANQQNDPLFNYLLINRQHWVKHFERLWFSGDYQGFIRVKSAFEQLLLKAKLGDEINHWAFDLLTRSPLPVVDNSANDATNTTPENFSWLSMATSALSSPQYHQDTNEENPIHKGAEAWRTWFDAQEETLNETGLPLFRLVATFLEMYYQQRQQWEACILVVNKAHPIYRQYEAWQQVILSLKSLAAYHLQLGKLEEVQAFEEQILHHVPYESSPPGFQAQQMLDIVFARLGRNAPDSAQLLLDQLKRRNDISQFEQTLEGLQADIHLQKENHEAAMPFYCKMWRKTLTLDQKTHIDALKKQFSQLREHLGEERFKQLFEQETEKGTPLPI